MNQPEISANTPSLTIEERIQVLADLILDVILEEEGGEDGQS